MKIFGIVALLVLVAAPVVAQTPITVTPTNVLAFTASADHNATFNGAAVLTNYQVELCPQSTVTGGLVCSLPTVVNLGKPTPDATNTILTPTIRSMIPAGQNFIGFVSAVGPGGTSARFASDPFGYPAAPVLSGKPSIK